MIQVRQIALLESEHFCFSMSPDESCSFRSAQQSTPTLCLTPLHWLYAPPCLRTTALMGHAHAHTYIHLLIIKSLAHEMHTSTQTIDIFCLIWPVMMSQFQQLHNLVLNVIQFSFPGLMGTCVECGSISLFALLVHLHISPWEWQHREQLDIILHRLECTQPHSTPIAKVYLPAGKHAVYKV